MIDEEVAARLAREVLTRRRALDMSQTDVVVTAKAAGLGLSPQTMNAIEQGKRDDLRPGTVEAIEHALRWEKGSITQIRAGNAPKPLAGNHTAVRPQGDDLAALRRDLEDLRRQVQTPGGEPGPDDEARTLASVLKGLTPEARRVFVDALGLLEDDEQS